MECMMGPPIDEGDHEDDMITMATDEAAAAEVEERATYTSPLTTRYQSSYLHIIQYSS